MEKLLENESEEQKKKGSTAGKWYRISTSDVAHGSDFMAKVSGATGWAAFSKDEGLELPIYRRMRTSLSSDMGPDMLRLTMYLQNHKKCEAVHFSGCHQGQRSMIGGIGANNKSGILVIGCVVANMPRGHYEGEAVRAMLQESCQNWQDKASKDCKLLNHLVPKIARDRKLPGWTDELACDVHDNITRLFNAKPPRVAMTQWNTFNDAFEEVLPVWHESLLPILNVGITDGWASNAAGVKFVEMVRACDAKSLEESRNVSAQEAKNEQVTSGMA